MKTKSLGVNFAAIPESLTEAVARRNLVLLVAAGLSRHASRTFPTYAELLEEVVKLATVQEYLSSEIESTLKELVGQKKYLDVAEYLRSNIPYYEFEEYISRRFTRDVEPGRIHLALVRLRAPLIITTNFDQLLERAYVATFSEMPEVVTSRHAHLVLDALKNYRRRHRTLLFKIHGTADSPSEIVFSERDYNRLLGADFYRDILRMVFMTKHVLVLGSSFSDPDLIGVISQVRTEFPRSGPDFIVLHKGKQDWIDVRRLTRTYGFEVIRYEPSDESHPEVLQLVEYLGRFAPPSLETLSNPRISASDQPTPLRHALVQSARLFLYSR